MLCKNLSCQKEFSPKKYNQKYCCPSCQNSANVQRWVDSKRKPCPNCQILIRPESNLCRQCDELTRSEINKDTKLSEYQNKPSVLGKHPSWRNAHIRQFARSWNKALCEKPCQKCGYKLHVELCHIRPIKDFGPDSTLGEINSPSNLLVLCRNHHWEFDNGYLKNVPCRN